MGQFDIFRASESALLRRLAEIDPESNEADMIRRERARRKGCAS